MNKGRDARYMLAKHIPIMYLRPQEKTFCCSCCSSKQGRRKSKINSIFIINIEVFLRYGNSLKRTATTATQRSAVCEIVCRMGRRDSNASAIGIVSCRGVRRVRSDEATCRIGRDDGWRRTRGKDVRRPLKGVGRLGNIRNLIRKYKIIDKLFGSI